MRMPGELEPGATLAGYRVERLIARGGMGVVYEAEQLSLGRRVAIKVIAPELAQDQTFRQRFTRESRLAAQLDHPNVIPVYEAGQAEGHLYLAMRLVRGQDLRAILAGEGRLPPERIARLVPQIAAALDAAHSAGLVHRDVKPGNVMVSGSGPEEHAYLTDFGLTKDTASQSGLTTTGTWVGTVDYVAPEQIEGRAVDARTDIYALGALLYHLAAGQPPFPGAEMAKMWGHVHTDPPSLAETTPEATALTPVVARAMAKDPADRHPSAGDVGRAVVAALTGVPASTPERSVASGAAAVGISPTQEREAPTDQLPDSSAPTHGGDAPQTVTGATMPAPHGPTDDAERRRRPPAWLLGVAGAFFLLIAGVAAGVVISGSDDPQPVSATAPTATEEATEPEPAPKPEEPPEEPEPEVPPEPDTPATDYVEHTPSHFGWTAQVPTGPAWSSPAESEPTPGELFRTTINGPGGLVVIVDYTPLEPARFGSDYISRREIGQPAFGSATEYVFRGGLIPQCEATTCVDIIINDESSGATGSSSAAQTTSTARARLRGGSVGR